MTKQLFKYLLLTSCILLSCREAEKREDGFNETHFDNSTVESEDYSGEPNGDFKTLISDYQKWWSYHYYTIDLSSDFIPIDMSGSKINKGAFLKGLTSGKFIALQLETEDNNLVYKLFKLDADADKSIVGTVASTSMTAYKHFKMEGVDLPDFDFEDLQGQVYTNANLKGKTIVLKCWFIACKPCVAEFPELNQLVAEYDNREDVVFISLAFDNAEKLDSFLKEKPFSYAVIPNQEEYMQQTLEVMMYPTHIVVGPQGKIQKVVNKSDELIRFLNSAVPVKPSSSGGQKTAPPPPPPPAGQ